MLFFKTTNKKITSKWYPQLVLVGKPAHTQEVAERIARQCTASPADSHAVIRALTQVIADIMAEGRAVYLDGFGSFHYTCQSSGNGVLKESEVSANQIKSVRVRFTPYRERDGAKYTRALVGKLSFTQWRGTKKSDPEDPDPEDPGSDPMV